jgi:hypothetical protein
MTFPEGGLETDGDKSRQPKLLDQMREYADGKSHL